MVKFNFIKPNNVITYVKPKVFWDNSQGLSIGKNSLEMFRFKIAYVKRIIG